MTPCREFQGYTNGAGYGDRSAVRFSSRMVHRQIMEMVYGPESIKGKVVMHTCDNPPCFRFDHLRIGTVADNVADKMSKGRWSNGTENLNNHCRSGHEFTDENTYVRPDGHRACVACRRVRTGVRNGTETDSE